MELLTILAADLGSEASEPDQGLFFALGGLLAAFAVLAGAYGLARSPMNRGAAVGISVVAAALVVAAMASSALTA